ncbi:type VII secretion target [Mycolicibacterium smegmatis]|uniref:type VII secretion target n=1 Tax=Mycolicibacterium smegmatis TaxID=1772 RepID=UPI0018EEFCB9|nr:type VII secretion target [Mycolicibacterium smegmatis]
MPALAVGAACGTVGFALTEQAKQLGSDVTVYAQKLRVAADRYERGDEEAAERIDFAGTVELPDAGEHPPVSDYEQALRDAGLLTGPVVPGSRYAQWLENASKNGVAPQTIVDIARTHNITPQSFDVLNGLQEVKDEDGKSFFILPPGTSKEDAKKAVVMTYILNAGTDYEAAEAGRDGVLGTADDVQNDFEETPYSAAEVQRIIDRQNANSWSYDQIFDKGGGGSLATTPNGMLMGLGGPVMDTIGVHGGTTYGDVFVVNIDGSEDPAEQLTTIIESGSNWYMRDDGQLVQGRLDLDRLLHHEERHSQQWAQKGFVRMARDYGLGALIEKRTGVNPLERDAGLSDGGYA